MSFPAFLCDKTVRAKGGRLSRRVQAASHSQRVAEGVARGYDLGACSRRSSASGKIMCVPSGIVQKCRTPPHASFLIAMLRRISRPSFRPTLGLPVVVGAEKHTAARPGGCGLAM